MERCAFEHVTSRGLGTQVAAKMLPDGTKALAPSDAAVVGQEFQADPVALGQVATGLLDVLPVDRREEQRHGQ